MRDPRKFVVTFGKYKGKTLDAVGSSDDGLRYLDWAVGESFTREKFPDFYAAARAYLAEPNVSRDLARLVGDD